MAKVHFLRWAEELEKNSDMQNTSQAYDSRSPGHAESGVERAREREQSAVGRQSCRSWSTSSTTDNWSGVAQKSLHQAISGIGVVGVNGQVYRVPTRETEIEVRRPQWGVLWQLTMTSVRECRLHNNALSKLHHRKLQLENEILCRNLQKKGQICGESWKTSTRGHCYHHSAEYQQLEQQFEQHFQFQFEWESDHTCHINAGWWEWSGRFQKTKKCRWNRLGIGGAGHGGWVWSSPTMFRPQFFEASQTRHRFLPIQNCYQRLQGEKLWRRTCHILVCILQSTWESWKGAFCPQNWSQHFVSYLEGSLSMTVYCSLLVLHVFLLCSTSSCVCLLHAGPGMFVFFLFGDQTCFRVNLDTSEGALPTG